MKNLFASKNTPIAIALLVVIMASVTGASLHAWASDAPPPVVAEGERAIRSRQPTIAEIKDEITEENKRHDEAMALLNQKLDREKTANAFDVGSMAPYCWTYDWKTNKAVKIPDCTPSF